MGAAVSGENAGAAPMSGAPNGGARDASAHGEGEPRRARDWLGLLAYAVAAVLGYPSARMLGALLAKQVRAMLFGSPGASMVWFWHLPTFAGLGLAAFAATWFLCDGRRSHWRVQIVGVAILLGEVVAIAIVTAATMTRFS